MPSVKREREEYDDQEASGSEDGEMESTGAGDEEEEQDTAWRADADAGPCEGAPWLAGSHGRA